MTKLLTGGLSAALLALAAPQAASAAVDVAVGVQLPSVQVVVAGQPPAQGPRGPAPGPGYTWEPERWERVNGAWVKQGGYWRPPAPVVAAPVVYEPEPEPVFEVDVAPPAPVVEVRPAMPYQGALWIPGYWAWMRGRHHWVAGRWSAPRPRYLWVAQRWDRDGHRWRYAPGRWARQDRDWDGGRRGRGHDDDHHRRGHRGHGHHHR
jgi:hypothetical protein